MSTVAFILFFSLAVVISASVIIILIFSLRPRDNFDKSGSHIDSAGKSVIDGNRSGEIVNYSDLRRTA
jgi:hypothetical protein